MMRVIAMATMTLYGHLADHGEGLGLGRHPAGMREGHHGMFAAMTVGLTMAGPPRPLVGGVSMTEIGTGTVILTVIAEAVADVCPSTAKDRLPAGEARAPRLAIHTNSTKKSGSSMIQTFQAALSRFSAVRCSWAV